MAIQPCLCLFSLPDYNISPYSAKQKRHSNFLKKKSEKISLYISCELFTKQAGVVGWCEGAVYLKSLGRPTDIGLQLGKACYPCTNVVGKGRGGMFLFLLFLHFHSCSSFFPVPLFHLLYSLFYLFSPFLWETTQNDPQGLTCR